MVAQSLAARGCRVQGEQTISEKDISLISKSKRATKLSLNIATTMKVGLCEVLAVVATVIRKMMTSARDRGVTAVVSNNRSK